MISKISIFLILITLILSGCVSPYGMSDNGEGSYFSKLENLEIETQGNPDVQNTDFSEYQDLISEVELLKVRISKIESLMSSSNYHQQKSHKPLWVCVIRPTFSEKKFLAKAESEIEARFNVSEVCIAGGADEHYCAEDKAVCTIT